MRTSQYPVQKMKKRKKSLDLIEKLGYNAAKRTKSSGFKKLVKSVVDHQSIVPQKRGEKSMTAMMMVNLKTKLVTNLKMEKAN